MKAPAQRTGAIAWTEISPGLIGYFYGANLHGEARKDLAKVRMAVGLYKKGNSMRGIVVLNLVFLCASLLPGCSGDKKAAVATASVSENDPQIVEIVANGLTFEMPVEIRAGWSTFRFTNKSAMVHFALIEKMPPGIGMIEQQNQVAPVFQEGMDLLNADQAEEAMAAFGKLPAWFSQVEFLGGPGFVSGGKMAETTVYLEPGIYLLECYVKSGGIFHSFDPSPGEYGMVAEFSVAPSVAPSGPPGADLRVILSAESGIRVEGVPKAGDQIVEVYFLDQRVHENFVGHDLQLVELAQGTDMDRLVAWMDWRQKGGLETPAPAVFIGGTNEMPAGSSAFLHLDLRPGRYAWISEVPDAAGKGLVLEFTVPGQM